MSISIKSVPSLFSIDKISQNPRSSQNPHPRSSTDVVGTPRPVRNASPMSDDLGSDLILVMGVAVLLSAALPGICLVIYKR